MRAAKQNWTTSPRIGLHTSAVLFTKWAQLCTDPLYAAMDFDTFKKLNIETLYFDNAAWRSECRDAGRSTTPAQRVNPPTKAAVTLAPSAGFNKRGRGAQPAAGHQGAKRLRLPQRQPPPAAAQPAVHKNAKPPAKPAARSQTACLRHLLHSQDPAQFPGGCQAPPPCTRNHNV